MSAKLQRQGGEDLPTRSVGAVSTRALLTIEDVAGILQVPPSWVYEHTRRRSTERIPGFCIGKYWRFREADVLAWIEGQRAEGRTSA
jgi:predicted DNA-binding transcriptional regulator AlpA